MKITLLAVSILIFAASCKKDDTPRKQGDALNGTYTMFKAEKNQNGHYTILGPKVGTVQILKGDMLLESDITGDELKAKFEYSDKNKFTIHFTEVILKAGYPKLSGRSWAVVGGDGAAAVTSQGYEGGYGLYDDIDNPTVVYVIGKNR